MPGLVPGIHAFCKQDVDGRDEPDHDEIATSQENVGSGSIAQADVTTVSVCSTSGGAAKYCPTRPRHAVKSSDPRKSTV
jgi:hypothetical protein